MLVIETCYYSGNQGFEDVTNRDMSLNETSFCSRLYGKYLYLLFCATTLISVKKSIGNQAEIHSSLRKAVFKGYQKDVKPDGQVEVKAGISIINLDLDPNRKVN